MDQFIIDGGARLRGKVPISGSKNAALPILIATLLTDEPCVIENVPTRLRDIRTTGQLLESLGKKVTVEGDVVTVTASRRLKLQAPYSLVKQMRASVLAAGPLLARFGRVRVPIPGGCAIGQRPIDIHIQGFTRLGAVEVSEYGDMILRAGRLRAARLRLKFPSVGATENLMMAAALIPGVTRIDNVAREPEIVDLADFLNAMGARVRRAGRTSISIEGVELLRGARHRVVADRIEAGTFLLIGAATRGRLRLDGARADHLAGLIAPLRRAGASVRADAGGITVAMAGRPRSVSVATKPYPGFPTDLQAPWLALMCLARGSSRVSETVFENRFLHAAELRRMGADVRVAGRVATVTGRAELSGAPIMASDLRAGAALLLAALAARGQTTLQRVYHIDRGYEGIEEKLRRVGARIKRVSR